MMKPALARHLRTYAAFHRHPMNTACHVIGIPLIVFHVTAMLDWVRIMEVGGVNVTLAMPMYLGVIAWYLTLHVRLALIMAVAYGSCFLLGRMTPWPWVVGIAVFAWTLQLVGHAVWEKRRPALATNLVQALVGPLYYAAVATGIWRHNDAGPTDTEE